MKTAPPQLATEARQLSTGRSVGKMLAATITGAVTGVAITFWVPALLSVDDFGYWRSFLLYAGYAGFLHFGMVDGALLDWTRPRSMRRGASLAQGLSALAVLHVAIAAAALTLLATPLVRRPHFGEIMVTLMVYALLFNLAGLIQVHLQARLSFSSVALGTAAPGMVFVLSLLSFRHRPATLDALLLAYLLAWAVTLTMLLAILFVHRRKKRHTDRHRDTLVKEPLPAFANGCDTDAGTGAGLLSASLRHIGTGWPIMLANTSYGLMQSADRVTVNLTRPIHDFAIYSLAQSSIYVPVATIAAVARVAFSHFAGQAEAGREQAYRDTVRLLTLTWMLLLPYYYAVEWVVARWLPRYAPGLPAGKVLLLSTLFLSLISVVQANAAALAGSQRRFFAGSVAAVLLAFVTAWIGSKGFGPLWTGSRWPGSLAAVAWSQVLSAALWWLGNEWAGSRQVMLPPGEIGTVTLAFTAAAAGLYLVSAGPAQVLIRPALLRVVVYYALEAIPIYLLYRRQLSGHMPLFRSAFSRPMGLR